MEWTGAWCINSRSARGSCASAGASARRARPPAAGGGSDAGGTGYGVAQEIQRSGRVLRRGCILRRGVGALDGTASARDGMWEGDPARRASAPATRGASRLMRGTCSGGGVGLGTAIGNELETVCSGGLRWAGLFVACN